MTTLATQLLTPSPSPYTTLLHHHSCCHHYSSVPSSPSSPSSSSCSGSSSSDPNPNRNVGPDVGRIRPPAQHLAGLSLLFSRYRMNKPVWASPNYQMVLFTLIACIAVQEMSENITTFCIRGESKPGTKAWTYKIATKITPIRA